MSFQFCYALARGHLPKPPSQFPPCVLVGLASSHWHGSLRRLLRAIGGAWRGMYQKAIEGPGMAYLMALLGIVVGNASEGERVSVYSSLDALRVGYCLRLKV